MSNTHQQKSSLHYQYIYTRDELKSAIISKFGNKLDNEFKEFVTKTDEILKKKQKGMRAGGHVQHQQTRTIESTMNLAIGELNTIKYAVNDSKGDNEQQIAGMLETASESLGEKLQTNLRGFKQSISAEIQARGQQICL